MLAERVMDWTQQWKQEGLEEGRREGLQEGLQEGRQEGLQEGRREGLQEGRREGLQKGLQEGREDTLEKARGVLVRDLERRFGPLSEDVLRRIEAIASIEDLMELGIRAATAPSLALLD